MHRKTHVNQILMVAFPQVVQEGTLTRVGVQENKILDAHAIPGCQGGLHIPQDLVTPLLQALCPSKSTSVKWQDNKVHDNKTYMINYYALYETMTQLIVFFKKICRYYFIFSLVPHSFLQNQAYMSRPFPLCPVFLKSYLFFVFLPKEDVHSQNHGQPRIYISKWVTHFLPVWPISVTSSQS